MVITAFGAVPERKCMHTVRKDVGGGTPFDPRYRYARCDRPIAHELVDDAGTVWGWTCKRHRKDLEDIKSDMTKIREVGTKTASIFHDHKYNPKDPHAIRPEGECEACDQIREEIRANLPDDPFEGLG